MTVVPTVWWLGFWRAGEHLYWWTTAVSPGADRGTVWAALRERFRPQVWQDTVDPAASGPAEAAIVAAGSLAWSDLEPHLTAMADAVPVLADPAVEAESAALGRRLRRVHEMAELLPPDAAFDGTPGDEQRGALVAEQIALALRATDVHRTAVTTSLDRAWSGPLVDPDANLSLCRALGALLLPELLRDHLAADVRDRESASTMGLPTPDTATGSSAPTARHYSPLRTCPHGHGPHSQPGLDHDISFNRTCGTPQP